MSRIKIKLITVGHLPLDLKLERVKKWKSGVFEIDPSIDNYSLRCDSDGPSWEFSDHIVKEQLPELSGYDFLIAIVNVPLEGNWYARRLGDNLVAFTFYEILDILSDSNIPLENAIYRVLYSYSLFFLRSGRSIPDYGALSGFTHDETRGCLFDMNGIKTDLVASCHNPQLCDECEERFKANKVSGSTLALVKKEIKAIRKDLYYRIMEGVKRNPIAALSISVAAALLIGASSSLIASVIWRAILK